jgi:hypothetical protein
LVCLDVAVVLFAEVAGLAAFPEVRWVAVRGVAVVMVVVDALGGVETAAAARTVFASAVGVEAVAMAVAEFGIVGH